MPKKKSNSIERDSEKLRFPFFQNIVYGISRPYLCKCCKYRVSWLSLLSKISLPHHSPYKSDWLFNIFWSTNTMEFVRPFFQSFNQSKNIETFNLWFSCQIAHYGKGLIAVFRGFFASINKFFILTGRLGTRLSFYQF